jgi:pathogenesis-related protein 1
MIRLPLIRTLPRSAPMLALACALLSACAAKEPAPAEDAPPVETATAPAEDKQATETRASSEPAEFAGMLEAHNRWRTQIGTPPLGWSRAAAQVAQQWADELAQQYDCKIRHSPGDERQMTWGENIYSYWRGGAYEGYRKTPEFVVDRWAGEGQWYDHASNRCNAPRGMVCGHFTQVVSTYSTHVGCGRSRCKSAEVWVCNYSPPGNYRGVKPY